MNKKLEINAALWNLANGEGVAASARTILQSIDLIPSSGSLSFYIKKTGIERSFFTGETDLGNVGIDEKSETVWEKELGSKTERIGHFKLSRVEKGKYGFIDFRHFWASDPGTSVDDSKIKKYCLVYWVPNRRFLGFGIWNSVPVLSLGCLHLVKEYLHMTHGFRAIAPAQFLIQIGRNK